MKKNINKISYYFSISSFGRVLSSVRPKQQIENYVKPSLIPFSFIFVLMSLSIVVIVHLGYSRVPDSLTVQLFVHTFVFDGMVCVISPLMLLYGSKELRKSLRAKFRACVPPCLRGE